MTFPNKIRTRIERRYREATIILEYGSGWSTVLAAGQSGKFIQSVECDFDRAMNLRLYLDENGTASPVVLYPPNGSARLIARHYPIDIWDQAFFRHPDLVLLNGRFRPACFAAVCLLITRPVRLLFDDYPGQPHRHEMETLAKPVQNAGRMAEFELEPKSFSPEDISRTLSLFSQVSDA